MKRTLALLVAIGLILGVSGSPTASAAGTLTRDLDPVVALGSDMPGFIGVPLDQLFVYKYGGGAWNQIPWQFDEVNVISGTIVASDNGLFDAQDQLVFMAADAGDQAPAGAWVADAGAATYPRYELAVNDPLDPAAHAWVYVFRSTTLASTITTDYVSFDGAQGLLTSDRYKLAQMLDRPAFDRLELNGSGTDILDRTKIRASAPLVGVLTEDSSLLATGAPVLTRAGRVRVVLNGGTLLAYRALFINRFAIDLSGFPISISWGRFSVDLSPAAAGSRYYDPNVPAGVVVDGAADTVPTTPAAAWSQVSGATGTVVRVVEFAGAGGTRTTYYKDNLAVDNSDTGDKKSYGDAGMRIDSPPKQFVFTNWTYVLPPNQSNIGAAYGGYTGSPLEVVGVEAPPAPVVTITRSGASDIRLAWPPVNGADLYRVWRSAQPYFDPAGTPDQESADTSFVDLGVAAGAANSTYYIVRAVDTIGADHFESAGSNRTGEITFALEPGSG